MLHVSSHEVSVGDTGSDLITWRLELNIIHLQALTGGLHGVSTKTAIA